MYRCMLIRFLGVCVFPVSFFFNLFVKVRSARLFLPFLPVDSLLYHNPLYL